MVRQTEQVKSGATRRLSSEQLDKLASVEELALDALAEFAYEAMPGGRRSLPDSAVWTNTSQPGAQQALVDFYVANPQLIPPYAYAVLNLSVAEYAPDEWSSAVIADEHARVPDQIAYAVDQALVSPEAAARGGVIIRRDTMAKIAAVGELLMAHLRLPEIQDQVPGIAQDELKRLVDPTAGRLDDPKKVLALFAERLKGVPWASNAEVDSVVHYRLQEQFFTVAMNAREGLRRVDQELAPRAEQLTVRSSNPSSWASLTF